MEEEPARPPRPRTPPAPTDYDPRAKGRGKKRSLTSAEAMESPGILQDDLGRPELNLVLELYLRELLGRVPREVEGVMLFGSALLDDLSPTCGDIDLIVGLQRAPGGQLKNEVEAIHRYLAGKSFHPWGEMVEAYYLPISSLGDGAPVATGLKATRGEVRDFSSAEFGPMLRYLVTRTGKVLHGTPVAKGMQTPGEDALLGQLKKQVEAARRLEESEDVRELAGAFTYLARLIYLLQNRRLVSKTEAARWLAGRYTGKVADALSDAIRVRRGETHLGPGVFRKALAPTLEAVENEIVAIERDHAQKPGVLPSEYFREGEGR